MSAQPTQCATSLPITRGSRSSRPFAPTRLTSIGAWAHLIERTFSMAMTRSVNDDAPDTLALLHQLESLVDVWEHHGVGDHRIDLDFTLHVPIDDFRHVGAAARAAEGCALPDAPGDQLERTGRDLRAGRGDADDDGLAPTTVARLERLAHHRDIARAIEGVVGAADLVCAALCDVDEGRE